MKTEPYNPKDDGLDDLRGIWRRVILADGTVKYQELDRYKSESLNEMKYFFPIGTLEYFCHWLKTGDSYIWTRLLDFEDLQTFNRQNQELLDCIVNLSPLPAPFPRPKYFRPKGKK